MKQDEMEEKYITLCRIMWPSWQTEINVQLSHCSIWDSCMLARYSFLQKWPQDALSKSWKDGPALTR